MQATPASPAKICFFATHSATLFFPLFPEHPAATSSKKNTLKALRIAWHGFPPTTRWSTWAWLDPLALEGDPPLWRRSFGIGAVAAATLCADLPWEQLGSRLDRFFEPYRAPIILLKRPGFPVKPVPCPVPGPWAGFLHTAVALTLPLYTAKCMAEAPLESFSSASAPAKSRSREAWSSCSPNHHIISPLGILPQAAWAIPKQHSNIGMLLFPILLSVGKREWRLRQLRQVRTWSASSSVVPTESWTAVGIPFRRIFQICSHQFAKLAPQLIKHRTMVSRFLHLPHPC